MFDVVRILVSSFAPQIKMIGKSWFWFWFFFRFVLTVFFFFRLQFTRPLLAKDRYDQIYGDHWSLEWIYNRILYNQLNEPNPNWRERSNLQTNNPSSRPSAYPPPSHDTQIVIGYNISVNRRSVVSLTYETPTIEVRRDINQTKNIGCVFIFEIRVQSAAVF